LICQVGNYGIYTKVDRPAHIVTRASQVRCEAAEGGGMKHIVGFSGGIDSQACARWVLNRYPEEDVILLNSNAGGNEHPLTEAFVEEYSQKVHPVLNVEAIVRDINRPMSEERLEKWGVTLDSKLSFEIAAALKGRFPASHMQFCTEALKLQPQRRWMRENLTDGDYVRYSGVRRQESHRRSKRLAQEWDDFFDCQLANPLVDWTKQMCFDYVRHHEEPINPLYSLGFERVGCAPCVNSSKRDIKLWVDRFPEMIDKVRQWEKKVGKTFFMAMVPGLPINWIDDVVQWSVTDYGGRQFNIFNNLERPTCESKFGLCE
jgi:3'-phosphoadenosine 5'-phosphosulfate sulfotransferase (PAPS reductase)/FAD synthetase